MPRKGAFVTMSVGCASSMIYLAALFLPFHVISFHTLTFQVARLKVYAFWATYEAEGNDFCKSFPEQSPAIRTWPMMRYVQEKQWFCPGGARERTLLIHDMAQKWCSETMSILWPTLCTGMERAYICGMVILCFVAGQGLVVQPVICYLLYDYINRKPDKKLRSTAQHLTSMGLCGIVGSIFVYIFVVTHEFDHAASRLGTMGFALSPSGTTGFGYGLFCILAAVIVQAVQLRMFMYVKDEWAETMFEQHKEAREHDVCYGTLLPASSTAFDGAVEASTQQGASAAAFGAPPGQAGAPWGLPPGQAGGVPAAGGGHSGHSGPGAWGW